MAGITNQSQHLFPLNPDQSSESLTQGPGSCYPWNNGVCPRAMIGTLRPREGNEWLGRGAQLAGEPEQAMVFVLPAYVAQSSG